MREYEIIGASRETGRDVEITMRASTEDEAMARAASIGILVSRVGERRAAASHDSPQQVVAVMGGNSLTVLDGKRIARSVAIGVFFAHMLTLVVIIAALVALPDILRTLNAWRDARGGR